MRKEVLVLQLNTLALLKTPQVHKSLASVVLFSMDGFYSMKAENKSSLTFDLFGHKT